IYDGMEVYFTTLGSGTRRWYSTLRTVLPVPTVTNNVVTYTGLFEIDNDDGALKPGMTTQVFFVSSAARGVITVPIGALTFIDNNNRGGDVRVASAQNADGDALRAAAQGTQGAQGAQGGVEGGTPSGFPQGAFGGGRGNRGGGGGAFAGGGRQGGGGFGG